MNAEEFSKIEKSAKEKIQARNRAEACINDALSRYVKDKTRTRSRKAALEKDAAIHSPRFKKLEDYDRFDDIHEAYGMGYITESQADKLEDMWEEREKLKAMSVDGVYSDLVTECLIQAKRYVAGMFEDEIGDFEIIKIKWEKELKESDELLAQMHEDYKAWKNGWGKYCRDKTGDKV